MRRRFVLGALMLATHRERFVPSNPLSRQHETTRTISLGGPEALDASRGMMTHRQNQVLVLMAAARTNAEIAGELAVADRASPSPSHLT